MSNWTLLSNHGHVLVCLSRDPEARLRDVAAEVGITERAVQKIVRDLQDGGMISVAKSGRRNRYSIHKRQTLRHELEADCTIRDLLGIINREPETKTADAVTGRTKPAGTGSGTRARIFEEERKAESAPPPGKPKAVKPAAAKNTGADDDKAPDGPEKQQGTLF